MTEPAQVRTPNPPRVAEPLETPLSIQSPPPARLAVKVDWYDVALWGWLAGVCFFGVRLIWSNARFRSRIRGYQPVADAAVTRLYEDCRAAFDLTRPVQLIESEEVASPAVYGLFRKWLLLPDGAFERFSNTELRCIFLHELAHIKRGDLAVNWLVAGLRVLHWFNPVLWLAWARMRADRELATDALALSHVRESEHASYGETILKVLEGLTGERGLPGLVGIVENKAQLKERLAAISRPGKHWKWAALAVTALITCLGLTGAQMEKPVSAPAGGPPLTSAQPVQGSATATAKPPQSSPSRTDYLSALQGFLNTNYAEYEMVFSSRFRNLDNDDSRTPDIESTRTV